MPTRYYPTKQYPSVRVNHAPGLDGVWSYGDIQHYRPSLVYRMKTAKTDGGLLTNNQFTSNRENNYDFPFRRFMSLPLEAQTISGTFDLLFQIVAGWDTVPPTTDPADYTDVAKVRYKVHIYIAVGQSTVARHVLLDNYVDSVDWPFQAFKMQTWTGLVSAQTLLTGSAVAGDVLVIELGGRITTAPTIAATYPVSAKTQFQCRGYGTTNAANVAWPDATAGSMNNNLAPWMEFSGTITEQALSGPPANETCATALVIPQLPYTSPFIDTTGSTDPGQDNGGRAAWWVWTADRTALAFFATYGTNYPTRVTIYTGTCGALTPVNAFGYTRDGTLFAGDGQSSAGHDVTQGVTYHIVVEHDPGSSNILGVNAGGSLHIVAFYREVPVVDDLYLVAGDVVALREVNGVVNPVNLSSSLQSLKPSSVGIDYTKRPLVPITGNHPNPHVGERLLVGLFDFDLVEILDLFNLSWAPSIAEIDFIAESWSGPRFADNPSQMHLTHAGFLWEGFFGNGFLLSTGQLNTALDSISDDLDRGTVYGIESNLSDSQPGNPFVARGLATPYPDIEITAPWGVTVDETANILFYTSGGFYSPETGDHPTRDSTVATLIKRYDLTNNVQLADFATVTPQAGNNPGLKGVRFIPADGGLLACNSTQVIRFNRDGDIVRTYTPSNAFDSQSLVDVVLTSDQRAFWVLDEATVHVYKFDLGTGIELADYQTFLHAGTTTQMQIYQPVALRSIITPVIQLLPCPPEIVAPPAPDAPPGPPIPPPAAARTLIFELPKRRWFYDQYDAEAIRTRLSDPGDDVYAQILGGTDGNLYQYAATAFRDDDTDLTYRIHTHWPDAGDPRGEKLASDLVLDVDPGASVNGITTVPVINNAQRILTPITVGAGLTGRQQILLNPISGQGLIARNFGFRIEGTLGSTDTARPRFYEWIFTWVPNWVNAGTSKAKFFQGLVLHVDNAGAASTFRVDSGDGTTQESFPVPTTDGEVGIAYSFVTPFEAHLVRLVPLGSWRALVVEWIWEPTAELAYHWRTQPTTHDLPGYLTVRDGMIAYASTFTVTWTISYTDGGSTEYTLPATGGAYTRLYIPCVARKGTAVTYDFVSDCPFQLFQRDCSVRIQGWGQPGGLQTMTPFGGLTRERGARV